jgi:hypothetical protein
VENQTEALPQSESESIKELATALAKAQGVIEGAVADSENPHWKSKYADLYSVWGACREPLTSNGLSVVQLPRTEGTKCYVMTMLMHSSGQWIKGELGATPTKQDPQGIGSCITYLRRYSLSAVVGVCPEDDDGNGAADKDKKEDKTGSGKKKQVYKDFKFLGEMTKQKKALSEEIYYQIMGGEGYEHSNEIPPKDREKIWLKLEHKRKEMQG